VPDVDVLIDDVQAVMRAAGTEHVSILATYESTIVASLFAAVYPERTKSLILVDPQATYLPTDETPWMPSLERWETQIELVRRTWGTPDWWDAPPGEEGKWFSRYARASVTPGGLASELRSYLETDVRAVLPSIQVPTLVLVDTDSFYEVLPETGHFVASKIPGARVVEHSSQGGHHFHWYARADAIVEAVGSFLSEVREEEASFDRVLATVLFTDIVDSTGRAAAVGDRDWRRILDRHDQAARDEVERFHGSLVKTTGDGILATFDAPTRALRCAFALMDTVSELGLRLRAAVYTGEIEILDGDVAGIGVHITSRVLDEATDDQIVVTRTVRELATGTDLRFEPVGATGLRSVPGEWELFRASIG
jgi:class 3 adenylate cyclase